MGAYSDAMELVRRLRDDGCTVNRLQVADMLEAYATTLHKWHVMPKNKMHATASQVSAATDVIERIVADVAISMTKRSKRNAASPTPLDHTETFPVVALQSEPETCPECGGSGVIDSGGFTPWGEPINVPCLCTDIDSVMKEPRLPRFEISDPGLPYDENPVVVTSKTVGSGVTLRVSADTEADAVGADVIGAAFKEECRLVGIGPVEVNEAGEITNVTVMAGADAAPQESHPEDPMVYCHACSSAGGADRPIHHEAPVCSLPKKESVVDSVPTPQDGKVYTLPNLNGDIQYVAGPPKMRPMETAPRDGTWILVFFKSGPADSPLECDVLRFSIELPKPFWLDRYYDAVFSDGCAEMLGWFPMPVCE